MSAHTIEQHKENIQPLPGGHSAAKLSAGFTRRRSSLLQDREHHEQAIRDAGELDDPLQAYIDYIAWVHTHYAGASSESGLVSLLERCTSCFRDHAHYKNDARYLRVWLEYTNLSDCPRDVFVYLAKKGIGSQLSLYYEEFAAYLEASGNIQDAKTIYQSGIEREARPLKRLTRSYENFCERIQEPVTERQERERQERENQPERERQRLNQPERPRHLSAVGRRVQSNPTHSLRPRTTPLRQLSKDEPLNKRQRLAVFKDGEEPPSALAALFAQHENTAPELGSVKLRVKENVFTPRPWTGETLLQKERVSSAPAKFTVYRDEGTNEPSLPERELVKDARGRVLTLVRKPGKRDECIHINVDLLYGDQEYCPMELLLKEAERVEQRVSEQRVSEQRFSEQRVSEQRSEQKSENDVQRSKSEASEKVGYNDQVGNDLHNVHVGYNDQVGNDLHGHNNVHNDLRGSDVRHTVPNRSPSPTVTIFSKMANREVIGMFNEAAADLNSDDEREIVPKDDTTNYDGFVTETIHNDKPQVSAPTPPTDIESASSPFLEEPSYIEPSRCSTLNAGVRADLLANLARPLSVYPGYHDQKTKTIDRARSLEALTQSVSMVPRGSSAAMIDFCGDNMCCLRSRLGPTVYLVETDRGVLQALRVESPACEWEFYVLTQIQRRLFGHDTASFVRPYSLFSFRDESYLFMDYCPQPSVRDMVQYYHTVHSRSMDEVLVVLIVVEVLRAVETLHGIGVLHGNVSPQNVMLRFEPGDVPDSYDPHGWRKSITLVDFQRAVDLTLFDQGTSFVDEHCSDQFCHDVDYVGVAAVAHTMLFGTPLKTQVVEGRRVLEAPLKNHWVCTWDSFFALLLNEKRGLRDLRVGLEAWLMENSQRKNLRGVVVGFERAMSKRNTN